jgi:two-component system, sporulation sensor kinase E
MKQALNNIIDNAVCACEGKEGKIKVSVGTLGTAVTIAVCDNGHGIPEDEIDKVFTPFFSSKPSGTGLGLPLAAKIIDLHGGHISVESEVGIGTTFRIHMTVKVPAEAVPSVR